jgi:hypothetical protein
VVGYGSVMLPVPSATDTPGYKMPAPDPNYPAAAVWSLRAGGRAGFQFSQREADLLAASVRVRFDDDSGQRRELWDDLSLKEVPENSVTGH